MCFWALCKCDNTYFCDWLVCLILYSIGLIHVAIYCCYMLHFVYLYSTICLSILFIYSIVNRDLGPITNVITMKIILKLLKFIFICVYAQVWKSEDSFQESAFSFHHVYIWGIKFRSSGLGANTLTHWAILLAYIKVFVQGLCWT